MRVFALIISLVLAANVVGQDKSFFSGARFMMGSSEFSKYNIDDETTVNSKIMFAAGVNANYFFTPAIGIGTDIMLNFLGSEVDGVEQGGGTLGQDRAYRDNFSFIRLELPLLAKLAIPVNDDFAFVAFGGPSFDFNLAGNHERNYDNSDSDDFDRGIDNLESISSSFKLGAGIMVTSKSGQVFMLDARISEDLNNFIEGNSGDNVRLSYFSFSVGVGF